MTLQEVKNNMLQAYISINYTNTHIINVSQQLSWTNIHNLNSVIIAIRYAINSTKKMLNTHERMLNTNKTQLNIFLRSFNVETENINNETRKIINLLTEIEAKGKIAIALYNSYPEAGVLINMDNIRNHRRELNKYLRHLQRFNHRIDIHNRKLVIGVRY